MPPNPCAAAHCAPVSSWCVTTSAWWLTPGAVIAAACPLTTTPLPMLCRKQLSTWCGRPIGIRAALQAGDPLPGPEGGGGDQGAAPQPGRPGHEPTLAWLAAQLTFNGKALPAERLAEFIRQWEATRTGSLEAGDEDSDDCSGSTRLEQAETGDPQQSALPELIACLDEQGHRIIRNCYLRRPPLSRFQLRRAMGGMEPEQLEQQALRKLRQAVEEYKHAFNA